MYSSLLNSSRRVPDVTLPHPLSPICTLRQRLQPVQLCILSTCVTVFDSIWEPRTKQNMYIQYIPPTFSRPTKHLQYSTAFWECRQSGRQARPCGPRYVIHSWSGLAHELGRNSQSPYLLSFPAVASCCHISALAIFETHCLGGETEQGQSFSSAAKADMLKAVIHSDMHR